MAVTSDRSPEAPATLAEDQPRSLGFTDQLGLWANLGISLLIPVTATFLVAPGQSFLATVAAIVAGTAVGCALLALVACGEEDRLCPPDWHRDIAASARHATLHIVPGAGHMLPLEQPARLAELIAQWRKA